MLVNNQSTTCKHCINILLTLNMDLFLLALFCSNPSQDRTFIPQKLSQLIPLTYTDQPARSGQLFLASAYEENEASTVPASPAYVTTFLLTTNFVSSNQLKQSLDPIYQTVQTSFAHAQVLLPARNFCLQKFLGWR